MILRIVVADDHELLRATFRMLIDRQPDMSVVGEAGDGAEAVAQVRSQRADLVLLDIRMPLVDGLAATELIASDPDLAGVKILILTTFEEDEYVARALRAGASGFLGKGIAPDRLLEAIRIVADGGAMLSPAATSALIHRHLSPPAAIDSEAARLLDELTPREKEITALIAQGLSNDEIAERLVISRLTVKTHANRSMLKVNARDRAQLVVMAFRGGLVTVSGTPHPDATPPDHRTR